MYRIGIDIGGTFTDFTVFDRDGATLAVEKCLTTPAAPEQAVMAGLERLLARFPALARGCERLNHATTLVTNAILERKGARTALVTTSGFRDVLETRNEYRYDVYDLFIRFPPPVVPRHLRHGVPERLHHDGSVRIPLDEARLRDVARALAATGIEAVAVCFLHSYRDPVHERRAAEILATELPGVALSVSADVDPEPREYERMSTTVLDAYVKPTVDRYLANLAAALADRGYATGLEIMLSNGGSTTAANARRYPIQMIESGPAAGVEAALWTCRRLGIADALSFDMGGTTAKLCVIRGGTAERSRRFEAGREHRFVAGSGLPVAVPVYDLVEIGAGGGSIARVDRLGLLAVGPDSAGAEPGPACYGRGGADPTVTDADLVLGHIDAACFLGGAMKLDADAARRALERSIGGPLGLDAAAAAHGVHDVVNETMASAARLHIAEKGCDPARLTVIAFGGAGPIHALALARKLGCPRVLLPPHAGVMSSFGLLTAPPAFERMATIKRLLHDIAPSELHAVLDALRRAVLDVLGDAAGVAFQAVAEMWHRGQEFPIEVPFTTADVDTAWNAVMRARFDARYRELYGRIDDQAPVEVSALRLVGSRPDQSVAAVDAAGDDDFPLPADRRVYDAVRRRFATIPVLRRASLPLGRPVSGPVAIQDRETGVVLGPHDVATRDASGAVLVELRAEAS
ncbi:MAG: hydantoinase/oxoprolinase family protein [Alphaproteobacteria bacterium]|nr:hydantoinase/oxoprolinase family protein [Alphaproteobacteria bacterium]